jgi:ribosome-associated protein
MSVKRTKVDSAKIPGLVDYTVELIREKKGYRIMIISLDKLTTFTDFLILCTVDSSRQGQAISDHILGSLKDQKLKPLNIEGYNQAKWILMDYVDFIVNIFDRETRDFYQLERIWRDAPVNVIKDEEDR